MFIYLRNLAITGNILFIAWMIWNGIDEHGQGATPVMIMSYIGLAGLLLLNILLLVRKEKK